MYNPILYIIDDDAAVLKAMSWLAGLNDIKIETYSNAKSFLNTFEDGLVGCILVDIKLPDMDGFDLHQKVRSIDPDMPVIFMTGYPSVQYALDAMKDGAEDFIEKPLDNDTILEAVHKAFANNVDKHEKKEFLLKSQTPLLVLTKREREVFELLVKGYTNKAIGIELGISSRTAETHRANVMKKTNTKTIANLMELNEKTHPKT